MSLSLADQDRIYLQSQPALEASASVPETAQIYLTQKIIMKAQICYSFPGNTEYPVGKVSLRIVCFFVLFCFFLVACIYAYMSDYHKLLKRLLNPLLAP